MNRKIIFRFAPMLALAGFIASLQGQEVSIPDPGLDAAVRQALQIPSGPLTEQDLLGLTNLEACCRNIASLSGLEAAHNLSLLDLDDNQLTDGSFPGVLTNLTSLSHLDLSENPLTDLVLTGGLTNLNLIRKQRAD
jgi:Leucine-rich repeat (LRR) protein